MTTTTYAVKPKPALADGDEPATNNMKLKVRNLLDSRLWQASERAGDFERGARLMDAGSLTINGASWMIRHLNPLPRVQPQHTGRRPRPSDVRIPDGHYMIDGRRFRITTPTEGKYTGRISLREEFTNGSSNYPRNPERENIIAWIASDWRAAAREYGMRTTRCGFCHRSLFDPVSVATGVGPDCRDKHGIPAVKPTD